MRRPWRQIWRQGLAALGLAVLSPAALAALGASVTLGQGASTDIYPGETTTLLITLSSSSGVAPVGSVAFSTPLPGGSVNGLRIAGAATYQCTDPATGTVNPAPAGTVTLGAQSITLTGGQIPARANGADGICTIAVPVTAGSTTGAQATYSYTIPSGAVTGQEGATALANSGAVSQSVNVRAMARPQIAKRFGPDAAADTLVLGGTGTTLTVEVRNTNPVPIADFQINDIFPLEGGTPAIRLANPAVASATCANNQAQAAPSVTSAVPGNGSFAGSGTVPARAGGVDGVCTFVLNVEAATTGSNYTITRTNTIDAATNFSTGIGLPAQANATSPITVRSPLRVAKTVSPESLANGQAGTFTVRLFNDSSAPLSGIAFTDNPIDGIGGAGLTRGAVTASPSCGAPTITPIGSSGFSFANGQIPAGGSCDITIGFTGVVQTSNASTSYTNALPAGAVANSANVPSQGASASVTVYENFHVRKSTAPANAAPGEPVRYQITVENWAAAASSNVSITEALSEGQTMLNGVVGGIDFTPTVSGGCGALSTQNAATGATGAAPNPIRLSIAQVPARANASTPGRCTVSFWAMTAPAQAGQPGHQANFRNTLPVGAVCNFDSTVCNGVAVPATPVGASTAVMAVAKAFNPAGPLNEGTVTRLTITLTNASARALTNVSLTDNLPPAGSGGGQMRVAAPANVATTCGTPAVTAVAGSTSIAMNGGTVPARASNGAGANGSCVVQVDVVGGTGTYSNTAIGSGTQTLADGTQQGIGPYTSPAAVITYNSVLQASKSFSPSAVSSGGRSTLTIRVANQGTAVLNDVAITDPLPTGMLLADPPAAYTTCDGATVVTATAGSASPRLTGARVPGGGSCEFIFDVVTSGGAAWVNSIPAGNITAAGSIRNQTPVAATLGFIAPSGLTVAKTSNPSTLTFPGQLSRMTVTITAGTQAVSNLAVTDYFTVDGTPGAAHNGMLVAATPTVATTCTGGIVTATPMGRQFSLSGASLAAGSACTFSVNVTSSALGGITNFIPPGGITSSQGLSNGGQASTSLTTQANVGITKQFIPNVVRPGERVRLRITFHNATAQPVTSIAVTDTLPAGVSVPAGANPVTTCAGATVSAPTPGAVRVENGTLGATIGGVVATCSAEIDVLVSGEGDFENLIPANGVTAVSGGTPVTNSQPASDLVRGRLPVVVQKAIANLTLDGAPVAPHTAGTAVRMPGAQATLTIRITNPNAAVLTAARFVDTLPQGLVVSTTPNASTTCAGGVVGAEPSGTTVRLSGATLAANASCTLTVNLLSNIPGTYTNVLAAGAVATFENVSNEEPTRAALTVSVPPTLRKQFEPAVIAPGQRAVLTIFLGNPNAAATTLTAALVDTLPTMPGPVTVASPANVGGTCATGSVTATPGAGTVSYANGASIPAGGCTILVNVTASTPGTHNNNIPAGALQTGIGTNAEPANAPLAVSTLGYVAGRVFLDNNAVPDGVFQSGTDTPLAGVPVELRAGPTCAAPLVTQPGLLNPTSTDALGNYLFSGLPAGSYSVCQPAQPAGTRNGIATAGGITPLNGSTGTPGNASNPAPTSSQIAALVLGASGTGEVSGSSGNNFAEIRPSSIEGLVFLDQNNNGLQNGADTPLAGVTLELLDAGGNVVASTTTAADGSYRFADLAPGTYSVRQPVQPAGTANGITTAGAVGNGGTPGTASAVATAISRIGNIVLPPNTVSSGNNFAEIPNSRSISGTVLLDYNQNGLLDDARDHGIGGQTIVLTGTDVNGNTITRSTTTAPDGSYRFDGLPEGRYTLTQPQQPVGTTAGLTLAGSTGGTATAISVPTSAIANIDLRGNNRVSGGNDFAEVPSAAPDLAIRKTHTPSAFGAGSRTGYYTITARNIGPVASSGAVTVTDTLPPGLTVAQPATGTGWTCTGAAGATQVVCTSSTPIAAGAEAPPIVLVVAVAATAEGQVLTNVATVAGGGEPSGFEGNNRAEDPTVVASPARVSGSVWRDLDHDRARDPGEPAVPGWTVELLNNGVLVGTTTTDSNGGYRFDNVAPGTGYEIRFREPGSGQLYGRPVPNEQGTAFANGTVGAGNPAGADNSRGVLAGLTIASGNNIVQQSLPLDPSGVVYDAATRAPVSGATVTLAGPPGFDATQLLGGALSQVTGTDGSYQFLLLPSAPAGTYTLAVTVPAGYAPGASTLLPACAATLAVGAGPPNPALVQDSNEAPAASIATHVGNAAACAASSAALGGGTGTTQYYLSFVFDPAGGSANLVNNHIPIDPMNNSGFVISKTGDRRVVEVGDTVLYTITVRRTSGSTIPQVTVRDRLPAGFTFVKGTARVNGATIADPGGNLGPVLGFQIGPVGVGQSVELKYRARVGVGSMQGTGINTARAHGCAATSCLDPVTLQPIAGSIASNEAHYQVQVTGGVFTDEACVVGKIFLDLNHNHIQDREELGIPGVRLYFQNGRWMVSDSEGKYSHCGLTPNSHVLKVDPHTLPRGARLTTSSNRNLGDAGSLYLDLKNGELHRADFIVGNDSHEVIEQVKARRAQGEVRSVETERPAGPALRFESKPPTAPPQATDANQPVVRPRAGGSDAR